MIGFTTIQATCKAHLADTMDDGLIGKRVQIDDLVTDGDRCFYCGRQAEYLVEWSGVSTKLALYRAEVERVALAVDEISTDDLEDLALYQAYCDDEEHTPTWYLIGFTRDEAQMIVGLARTSLDDIGARMICAAALLRSGYPILKR